MFQSGQCSPLLFVWWPTSVYVDSLYIFTVLFLYRRIRSVFNFKKQSRSIVFFRPLLWEGIVRNGGMVRNGGRGRGGVGEMGRKIFLEVVGCIG